MADLIFPNCSYFVCYGANAERRKAISELSKQLGCRFYFCSDIESLDFAFHCMKRKVGCLAFLDEEDGTAQRVVELIEQNFVPYLKLNKGSSPEKVKHAIHQIIKNLIPKELDKLVLSGVNAIFPSFFQGIGSFTESSKLDQSFDRQIIFSTVSDDLIGMCDLRASLEKIINRWPDFNEDKAIGNLKEAVNQFLGLVTQGLSKININPKIGLPTVFNLSKIPEVQTLVFFPSIQVCDASGILNLSLGYTDLEGGPCFDLSGVDLNATSDEVEFL